MAFEGTTLPSSRPIKGPTECSHAELGVRPQSVILMVEPNEEYATDISSRLTSSSHQVIVAAGYLEVRNLPSTAPVSIAVLSDTLGDQVLRAVAERVRRQWPPTRILLLRSTPLTLEDHLYDDAVKRSSGPERLCEAMATLSKIRT